MGYGTRDGIKTFTPDDTEDCFWIPASVEPSIEEILVRAGQKWGGDFQWDRASLARLQITAENIQTDCLGYDLYDYRDYRDYLKITLLK